MKGSDALVLITEWNQFRRLDLNRVKNLLAEPVFFDLRNIYESEEVEKYGIDYIGVGVPGKKSN
jgi:UDPglucose 6-dehydrogenase